MHWSPGRWMAMYPELASAERQQQVMRRTRFVVRSSLWRLDDIARDVGKLTLDDQVWEAFEHYCDSVGARLGLAEKQLVVACPYCGVGNPVGEGKCSACGGGLADVQPVGCRKCGFVMPRSARFCSRCGTGLAAG